MLKKLGVISAIIAVTLAVIVSVPALATGDQARTVTSETTAGENARTVEDASVAPTFSQEVYEEQDAAKISFGQSLLFAGNNAQFDGKTSGLLFAFGNGLTLNSRSDYAFVAGNEVNFSAETEHDLFVAGNIVSIKSGAKVGRDVFVAAYRVNLEADLTGSFSATASQVVLKNVKIAGNVNLSAENIAFEGEIEIAGTLIYNSDANVSGLNHVKYGAIETYTPEVHTQTAAEFWFSEITSIVSLFIAAIVVFAVWPRARAAVTDDGVLAQAAGNLAYGFIFLLAVPFAVILLLISYVAAPVGIIAILAYIIMIYLSQAFTGAWLGHVILAKGLRVKLPVFVEALVGILALSCLALFPGLNFIVGFLAVLFGLGMMIRCLKSQKAEAAEVSQGVQNSKKKTRAAKAAKSASKSLPKRTKSGAKKK